MVLNNSLSEDSESISTLREKFLASYAEDVELYDARDIARVQQDDVWLTRFYRHNGRKIEPALAHMCESLRWRKDQNLNDLSEESFPPEYFEIGGLFAHNRDLMGVKLLIFRVALHSKSSNTVDELKKYLLYWMEKCDRIDNESRVTVFLDLTDAGLGNFDLDFIRFLISLFNTYYPYFLQNILVLNMPWILNAAFKIVKSWLPPIAIQKIKFINKKNISEYISPDQQLVSWGGTDDHESQFKPELIKVLQEDAVNKTEHIEEKKRKVRFAEDVIESGTINTSIYMQDDKDAYLGKLLRICPAEELLFLKECGENAGSISLQNVTDKYVSYKVKTTSPEKYRVRPSIGLLAPGSSKVIAVHIHAGYSASALVKDRFLVLGMTTEKDSMTNTELSELWKSSEKEGNFEQHKLRCTIAPSMMPDADPGLPNWDGPVQVKETPTEENLIEKVTDLHRGIDDLKSELKFIRHLLIILILLVLIPLFVFVVYNTDIITYVSYTDMSLQPNDSRPKEL